MCIPCDATELDSKKEYRRLALKFHPDKQLTEEDRIAAHSIFAKLSVSDPVKRHDWKEENAGKRNSNNPLSSTSHHTPTKKGKETTDTEGWRW